MNEKTQPNEHMTKMNDQKDERIKQMFDLNLRWDGSCFNSDNGLLSVSHLDVLCYNDIEWDKTIELIEGAIA